MLAKQVKPQAVAEEKTDTLITAEELLAMGDIGPCELIDGRIVRMSPTGGEHSFYEVKLSKALSNFVDEHKLGRVLGGEIGLFIRKNPDRIRAADVLFASKERLGELPKGYLEIAPDLIVEIVSPSDRWDDIQAKLADYFALGVERVWIVEPARQEVRVYKGTADFELLTAVDTLRGEGILSGFELSLATFFTDLILEETAK